MKQQRLRHRKMLVYPFHPLHNRREAALPASSDLGDGIDDVPCSQFMAEVDQAFQVSHRLDIRQAEIRHRLAAAQGIARE